MEKSMDATEAIVEVLEGDLLPFTPKEVAIAARELGIEEDIEAISRQVLEEGVRRSMEAIRGVRETFGELPYPEDVLEEHLREGGWLAVTLSKDGLSMYGLEGRGDSGQRVHQKESNLLLTNGEFSVLTQDDEFIGSFYFHTWPGVPRVYLRNLYATTERVFFKEHKTGLGKALKNVRALRPLFSSLRLSDIERAIEALAELGNGEARMEDSYVLVRSGDTYIRGDTYILRRGSVLGDQRLDKAVFLGKEVRLSFPGDVEIVFKTRWDLESAGLDWVHIRLGEEEVFLYGRPTSITPIHKNPLVSEIRRTLVRGLEERRGEFSPRMLAFLKAFLRHEDPFRALAEGRFHAHVTAEFFLES
jgi:hypothetical protein